MHFDPAFFKWSLTKSKNTHLKPIILGYDERPRSLRYVFAYGFTREEAQLEMAGALSVAIDVIKLHTDNLLPI